MEKVYFPVIEIKEHEKRHDCNDSRFEMIQKGFTNMLVLELIQLEYIVRTRNLNHFQNKLLGSLMKRLFSQIPITNDIGPDQDKFKARQENLLDLLIEWQFQMTACGSGVDEILEPE